MNALPDEAVAGRAGKFGKSGKGGRKPRRAVFAPRAMGICVFGVLVLAFIAGIAGREIGLVLAGAVFSTIWAYCLVMTLLLALVHGRRTRRASIQVSPTETTAGTFAEAFYGEGENRAEARGIFQLPGILVRCRLILTTKDGRRIWHDFSPAKPGPHPFEVRKRGAYFSSHDEFAVFDILGFFRFAFRLATETAQASDSGVVGDKSGVRLLAKPRPAGDSPSVNARSGDSSLKPELSLQRSDILIDHRPYVPGDDPRRINWKLYGHGGSLFVREGEREPPPHANLAILIDDEYDPVLYGKSQARRAIDLLCENALAAAIACTEAGMNVFVGSLEGTISGGTSNPLSPELASSLAWPAARPMRKPEAGLQSRRASPIPCDCGILVFALPRSCTETALDRFLKAASGPGTGARTKAVDLLFVCHRERTAKDDAETGETGEVVSVMEGERLSSAELCVSMFNQRPGIRARIVRVEGACYVAD